MKITKFLPVFFPFLASDWTDQSDAVRGGVSFSKLDVAKNGRSAVFTGNLNTTIFNAGFSSQRTTRGDRFYDWSDWKGIQFEYETPDCKLADKIFTIIIKDRLQQGDDGPPRPGFIPDPTLPPGPDTVAFQYNFKPECNRRRPRKTYSITPKFKEFEADYRGEPAEGELNLKTIRRFTVMVRSFDETRAQDGDFKSVIKKISLYR